MARDYLESFNVLSAQEISDFEALATERVVKKGDFFITEGKACKEVAFLKTGILRSFYLQESGEEVTYCITFPNTLMTAYASYITGLPALENIQAIAAAELLIISKQELDKLAQPSFNWMKFSKIIAGQQYVELEKRFFMIQKEKAKKRYMNLLINQPDYVQQIPLQYLASYLGITGRHLSRLRKEITF